MENHETLMKWWVVFRVLGLVLDIGLVVIAVLAGLNGIRSYVVIAGVSLNKYLLTRTLSD
jgi:hypothetical protein